MDEKTLCNTAIMISIIGITILYLISSKIEINDTTIEKINQEELDKNIKITGKIKSIRSSDSFTVIKIEKTDTIDAILYDSVPDLDEGMYISISGQKSEYQENSQITVDKIEII